MPLTEAERLDCERYCFRNWRVRLTPRTSRVLIGDCLELMPTAASRAAGVDSTGHRVVA